MTGKELRDLREELGIPRKVLAEKLGVVWQTLQKWELQEDEQVRIPAKHLATLANELGISVDRLYPSQKKQSSSVATASNGAAAANAGGAVSQVVGGDGMHLRPLERQLIELNREHGNDSVLKGVINKLLEVKTTIGDMFR